MSAKLLSMRGIIKRNKTKERKLTKSDLKRTKASLAFIPTFKAEL